MERRIENAMTAEKARMNFYNAEQERFYGKRTITDVKLAFNFKNKKCDAAIGNRSFNASEFVRFEKNGMVFKREQDAEETFIRNSWIKNYDHVINFIEKN